MECRQNLLVIRGAAARHRGSRPARSAARGRGPGCLGFERGVASRRLAAPRSPCQPPEAADHDSVESPGHRHRGHPCPHVGASLRQSPAASLRSRRPSWLPLPARPAGCTALAVSAARGADTIPRNRPACDPHGYRLGACQHRAWDDDDRTAGSPGRRPGGVEAATRGGTWARGSSGLDRQPLRVAVGSTRVHGSGHHDRGTAPVGGAEPEAVAARRTHRRTASGHGCLRGLSRAVEPPALRRRAAETGTHP